VRPSRQLVRCVLWLQGRSRYRHLARRVGAAATVRAARPPDLAACRRLIGAAAQSGSGAQRLYVASLGPFVLAVLPVNDRPVGAYDGWFVGFVKVHIAARGMGLAERLFGEAERAARAAGAHALWGIVTVGNTPMERLAAKVGLEPYATAELTARLDDVERSSGLRRTYLRKDLTT
jgi:L-amino acid N-acyltransferase YncA